MVHDRDAAVVRGPVQDRLATISTRLPSGSRSSALRLLFPVSCGGWTAGTPAAVSSW